MKNLVVLTGAGMSAESAVSVHFVMQVVYGISIRWSKWLLQKGMRQTLNW